jgi:hypothetical protein
VSDTPPASGNTKRISINNILACSPTATLASATITGDLTAARLIVTGGTIPTNGLWLATTNTLEFAANSLAQYRIAPLGVFSWFDGAGGTRMTLNSTGLGVGVSPTYNIDVLGATLPTIAVRATSAGASNARLYLECAGTNSGNMTYNRSLQALQLGANGPTSAQVTLDSAGNVGVGTASPGYKLVVAAASGNVMQFENTSDSNRGGRITNTGTAGTGKFGLTTTSSGYALSFGIDAVEKMLLDTNGNLILSSSATPATLTTNGQLTVNATSNTNLRFSYRGSDGTTRVANITLA